MKDWADEIEKTIADAYSSHGAILAADGDGMIAAALRKAKADGRLDGVSQHALTLEDLKVVERHCDWVSFKHAMGALYNYRAAKIEKGQ